jgi:cob(I)alamin adenosyltransferase
MPIYTRTGDTGETGLFGGGRVSKDDARVEAYGEVDELNAALGVVRSLGLEPSLEKLVRGLQDELFTVGAVLATPEGTKAAAVVAPVQPTWVARMEAEIDAFDRELPPLTQFILPAGSPAAAALHLARTVCRRAERKVVALHGAGQVAGDAVRYLNRLSDLLFTLARVANHRAGVKETAWNPPRVS